MKKRVFLPILMACLLGLMTSVVSARGFSGFSDSHYLSAQDVDLLFHDLPRYLDLGSFVINRLHHLPQPVFEDHCMMVAKRDGTILKTRAPFSYLETQIQRILEQQQGDWSVYVKDLKTGEVISINDHEMQSASLIKLYVAGAILERIENGKLEETDSISQNLQQMIVVSSNEATNSLIQSFYKGEAGRGFQDGMDVVNDFIERYGYEHTKLLNGLNDPTYWINPGYNYTSPADCGKLLEDIYNSKMVSHYASYRFENLLNRQEVNYKIPSGLPSGTHIGHKTGEISDTENDAAIIYTPYGDYIFCIMSTKLYSTGSAVDTIRRVTRLVHDWFMHPITEIPPETADETGEAQR